ncbi:membrane protein containing Beta-lactamase-like domain protein [Candidatus Magnetomorum sp. HK-1]|nr:membrane protein containing Beta-lactamase-like domain protein [Candidatus Magnetomorum sp. HK-1]
MKNPLSILILFFIVIQASCISTNLHETDSIKKMCNKKGKLLEHSKEFEKNIIKVNQNVYVAIGYGLANSILVIGKTGAVIIDVMESVEQAKIVRTEFEKITKKPVKALIYTHNHADHVFGGSAWSDTNPDIYSHETTAYYIEQILNKMRPIIGTRSMRMFGNYLDDEDLINAGIGPNLKINENSTVGILFPNKTFTKRLKTTIAGIHLELIHAPGETNDQIYVWLPKIKALICGDNFYKSFPNLYTIRGTRYRSLEKWVNSLDIIRRLKPEYLIPCHSKPIKGSQKIYKTITDYRDAIQFVHDQTIRRINQGFTPDELVEIIRLPKHLAESPYLQEYYGKVSWAVRSVFNGHLGWFNGNASMLQPLTPDNHAKLMLKIAGSQESLIKHAKNCLKENDNQAALQLTDYILRLDPENDEAKSIRTESLMSLAKNEENANARHYYFTEAMEIEDDFVSSEKASPNSETVNAFPLVSFFNMLKVNLNSQACVEINKKVGFVFTDTGDEFTVWIRKGVAEVLHKLVDDLDIKVSLDSKQWKEMLAQIRSPMLTIMKFKYEKGNAVSMTNFLKLFLPPEKKLGFQKID